jgi:hypothetical protein
MKLKVVFLAAIICLLVLSPRQILAHFCACCAERGDYSITTKKLQDHEISELERLKISETTLYTNAGSPDNIKGITPLTENYTASLLWQKAGLKFDFKNDKNGIGLLNLLKSPTVVDFRTDTYNEGEPILYKELRFKAKVSKGTGFFKKGIAPSTEYFLVLQGKGNNCMAAEDFTHWRLEIKGKKADYAFFGKLSAGD